MFLSGTIEVSTHRETISICFNNETNCIGLAPQGIKDFLEDIILIYNDDQKSSSINEDKS